MIVTKASDAYEWRVMNKVFSREEIINKVFRDSFVKKAKIFISKEDKESIYDLCQDYYVGNVNRSTLYKKYTQFSKTYINKVIHSVIWWWKEGLKGKTFTYSLLEVQDAYLSDSVVPNVYFGSADDYYTQRTMYILSGSFINPSSDPSDMSSFLYHYYIYGQSLDKLLKRPEDIVKFYNACKNNGFINSITIKEFASSMDFSEEVEAIIKSKELEKVQKVQEKIEYLEHQISLLKDELNSCKAEKRLLYKSMDMEEDDLYVQTSFEV